MSNYNLVARFECAHLHRLLRRILRLSWIDVLNPGLAFAMKQDIIKMIYMVVEARRASFDHHTLDTMENIDANRDHNARPIIK
jgi:hypothetical protein